VLLECCGGRSVPAGRHRRECRPRRAGRPRGFRVRRPGRRCGAV